LAHQRRYVDSGYEYVLPVANSVGKPMKVQLSEQGLSNSHAARLPHQGQGHLEAEEKGKNHGTLSKHLLYWDITREYITEIKHHQKLWSSKLCFPIHIQK